MLKLGRLQSPLRRVLAIDAGSRRLRLLLAESDFGALRVLKQETIDLQAEGLVSAEESKAHLQGILENWGRPPIALVLPQHLATSQVIDLPPAPESEVAKLIQDETVKLSGVTDSRIIHDFVRIESAAKNKQQFWVTICQESNIRDRILQLGVAQEDICEVTTAANALLTAYRSAAPGASRAILVHLGAETTVVVILLGGQGAYAASFQMGSDFFTRAIARIVKGPEDAAETLKRENNLLQGEAASAEFATVVDGWVAELKRQLNEWFSENPGMAAEVATFPLIASGGGFDQPGLLEYIRDQAGLAFERWPATKGGVAHPDSGFEIAFGTALQALGHSPQPVSLLPEDYRSRWRKRLFQQRLEIATIFLIFVCIFLLGIGTWYRSNLIERKKDLLKRTLAAQEAYDSNEALAAEMAGTYETLRPLFAAEQNTRDMLQTFALLQQTRQNRSFWYAVLADQQSYFNPPASFIPTNRVAKTNVATGAPLITVERPPFFVTPFGPYLPTTNASPARPGCIAELSMAPEGEAARALLSDIVNQLKQQSIFSRVDSLSDDLRRNLAEPKVVIPDRHFVLALDFAETDFQQPIKVNKKIVAKPAGSRRATRVAGAANLVRPRPAP